MVRLSNWGPSTICTVFVRGGNDKVEVRINTAQLERAQNEYARSKVGGTNMASIAIKVRLAYIQQNDFDPGWLDYDELKIVELRKLPAGV